MWHDGAARKRTQSGNQLGNCFDSVLNCHKKKKQNKHMCVELLNA